MLWKINIYLSKYTLTFIVQTEDEPIMKATISVTDVTVIETPACFTT